MAEINHCSFFSPTPPSPTLQLSIAPTMPSTSAYEGTLACEELKWTIAADSTRYEARVARMAEVH